MAREEASVNHRMIRRIFPDDSRLPSGLTTSGARVIFYLLVDWYISRPPRRNGMPVTVRHLLRPADLVRLRADFPGERPRCAGAKQRGEQ